MGKAKKQKNGGIFIFPGKRYLYRTRKILFALAIMTFILNMSLIAVFDASGRKDALISILLSVLFAVSQFLDDRKAHWNWPYIVILCAMFHFFSGLSVFSAELLFMRYIWAGELILFSVFIGLSLYKIGKN